MSEMPPTSSVVACTSPRPPIQDPSSCQALSPSASVPVIFGSSPMVTSIAAPNRKPVTTALERNWEIHPILRTESRRKTAPTTIAMPATRAVASFSPETSDTITALPATAASAELGPTEICRDVQKSA